MTEVKEDYDGIFKLFLGQSYTPIFNDEVMKDINDRVIELNIFYKGALGHRASAFGA